MIPTFSLAVDIIQPEQWLFLLGVCVPLTGLWAYALLRCLRDARAAEGPRRHPLARGGMGAAEGPLDPMAWALLIVLTGWFGALAYLFSVVLPGLMRRLQMPDLVRKIHAPVS